MAIPTYLIVGLGNPGAQYQHTRHNVGFDVLSLLAGRLGCAVKKLKYRALVGEARVEGGKVVLAAPQTYMNLSGEAVALLLRHYRVDAGRLLVIYDDVDLPPGVLRIRREGSAGTHNGMRNIIQEIGTEAFARIRVGVGGCREGYDLADWVLSRYNSPQERQQAFDAYNRAADAALAFVHSGVEVAMREYNHKKAAAKADASPTGSSPQKGGLSPE